MSGNEAKNVSADADGRPTADSQQAPHHPLANQRDVGSWRTSPSRAFHHCIQVPGSQMNPRDCVVL